MDPETESPAPEAETATTQEPPAETASGAAPDHKLPDDHPVVKALAKANAEAATSRKRLQELEDRDKSELDRARDAATQAETDRAALETQNARLQAAVKFGLSEDDLALLGDGPAEGFMERAAALAERLKSVAARPDPNAGSTADAAGSLDERIAAAQKAGDVNAVLRLQNQKLAK